MTRQEELTKIIIDAEQKELLIETRIIEGNLTLDQQINHLDMHKMNMDRRALATRELNKLNNR